MTQPRSLSRRPVQPFCQRRIVAELSRENASSHHCGNRRPHLMPQDFLRLSFVALLVALSSHGGPRHQSTNINSFEFISARQQSARAALTMLLASHHRRKQRVAGNLAPGLDPAEALRQRAVGMTDTRGLGIKQVHMGRKSPEAWLIPPAAGKHIFGSASAGQGLTLRLTAASWRPGARSSPSGSSRPTGR